MTDSYFHHVASNPSRNTRSNFQHLHTLRPPLRPTRLHFQLHRRCPILRPLRRTHNTVLKLIQLAPHSLGARAAGAHPRGIRRPERDPPHRIRHLQRAVRRHVPNPIGRSERHASIWTDARVIHHSRKSGLRRALRARSPPPG